MDRKKQKRVLAFEQLDSRIAMNADMCAFHDMDRDAVRDRIGNALPVPANEFRATSFEVFERGQARALPPLFSLQSISHSRTAGRFLVSRDMDANSGGEPPQLNLPPVLPSNSQNHLEVTSNQDSGNNSLRSENIVRSGFTLVLIKSEPAVLNYRSSQTLSQSTTQSTTPSTTPANQLAGNVTTIFAQSPRRESLVVATQSQTSFAAPPIGSNVVVPNVATLRNSIQNELSTSGSFKENAGVIPKADSFNTFNSTVTTKKLESTKSMGNGMLEFSLRGSEDNSKIAQRSRAWSLANSTPSMSSNDQAILAENDRLYFGAFGNSRNLPAPKGMIEIGNIAEVTRQPAVVYKASNSPFEILQLVFGSNTNVAQESKSPLTAEKQSDEFTDLATREESILALAIGTLFAMAIRQKRKTRSPFQLVDSLTQTQPEA